jgi:putative hemolysin
MVTDILFVLLLILINGAFALSEIAIISSKRTRLVHMAETGNSGARQALVLASEPTRFLSSVQAGITSIGILNGAIGEKTIAGPVRAWLGQVDAIGPYAEPLSLAIVVVSITYVSLILGELVPKRLALTHPEKIAAIIARPMQLVAAIGRPVVYVLSVSTDTIMKLLGVRHVNQSAVTMEEIKVLIEQGTEEGVLEPSEHEMMTNVLNLDERHVGTVLTPSSEVVFLDVQDSAERNRERLRQEPHDVLPLCDGGLQHVLGFVRTRRVLEQVLGGQDVDLPALAEPALFVPETISIMTLLEQFKRTNLPAALVVDEFGEVEGLVSLTDVMTAIVGELPSEGVGEPMIVKRDDRSWLVDGSVDLATLVRTLKDRTFLSAQDRQHYHTLGGLAMVALRRVPRTGDVFERGRYRFEVVDMDGNRVDRVLLTRIDPSGVVPPATEHNSDQ